MASFSRDVLKWLQSLELSSKIKNPKWDFSNGYLVAEILFWYFPREMSMHSYINGTSLESKVKNWSLLKLFFKRHQFCLPEKLIDGTLHCKEDAAILLINLLFEILTTKSPTVYCSGRLDDLAYQQSLALHARSTAAKTLKNNLSTSELVTMQDLDTNQAKALLLLERHADTRAAERRQEPSRFQRGMSPGERCLRRHPGPLELQARTQPLQEPDMTTEAPTAWRRRSSAPDSKGQSRDQLANSQKAKQPADQQEQVVEISVQQKSKYSNYMLD